MHLDHVPGWNGTLTELAQAIGNMRYDRVAEFLDDLRKDFLRQAQNDGEAGRSVLADRLRLTAYDMGMAQARMEHVWKTCEPHMKARPNLLQRCKDLASEDRTNEAIDELYLQVDTWLHEGQHENVADLLRQAPLMGLPLTLLVGLLSITLPLKDKLARERALVAEEVKRQDPERQGRLLAGLEVQPSGVPETIPEFPKTPQPVNVQGLRETSQQASKGPWIECGHHRGGCPCGLVFSGAENLTIATAQNYNHDDLLLAPSVEQAMRNARYMAAASPDVVLRLVDVADAAKRYQAAKEEIVKDDSNFAYYKLATRAYHDLRLALKELHG